MRPSMDVLPMSHFKVVLRCGIALSTLVRKNPDR
jgi:hypothetical protein